MKIISYQKSIKTRTPYGHSTDIQSLRTGFCGGGGNVTALAELGGRTWQNFAVT